MPVKKPFNEITGSNAVESAYPPIHGLFLPKATDFVSLVVTISDFRSPPRIDVGIVRIERQEADRDEKGHAAAEEKRHGSVRQRGPFARPILRPFILEQRYLFSLSNLSFKRSIMTLSVELSDSRSQRRKLIVRIFAF